MNFRIKKMAAWLILSVTVLVMAAGCSAFGTAPAGEAASGTTRTETTQTKAPGAEKAKAEAEPTQTKAPKTEKAKAGTETEPVAEPSSEDSGIDEYGSYSTKDEVALYLHTFGRLPDNYITKKEAQKLGWDSKKGNLTEVAPGKSIGGSYFGNYEEQLPEKDGRKYYECDLEYDGGYRGAKRIIYSNDGLVFYTGDHYQTFEQLY